MEKRGQVAIFIILGIVILAVIGMILYARVIITRSQSELEKEEITLSQFQINSIKTYIESCIETHADNTLKLIYAYGGHLTPSHPISYNEMELSRLCYINPRGFITTDYVAKEEIKKRINDSVNDNFLACLDDFKIFRERGIEIMGNEFTVQTEINYYKSISVKVNYPITIKKEDLESKLSDFSVKFPYEFGNIYRAVREIIVESVVGGFTEEEFNYLTDVLLTYYPTITITRNIINENTYVYKISSVNDIYDFYFACTTR